MGHVITIQNANATFPVLFVTNFAFVVMIIVIFYSKVANVMINAQTNMSKEICQIVPASKKVVNVTQIYV